MRVRIGVTMAAVLLTTAAQAGGLTVSDAWFRVLPAGRPAAGYFTLTNATDGEASLTGAASPACGSIMLHKSTEMSGMSMMEMVDSVAVPAHGRAVFAPGGYHLMCMQPAAARMKPGAAIDVTLRFAGGANLTARFAVKDAKGD